MFLELPVIIENEEEEVYEINVDINPFQVVAIEPYSINKKHCILILISGAEYEVCMTRRQLRKRINDFVKENVLTKLYKEIRNDQNN